MIRSYLQAPVEMKPIFITLGVPTIQGYSSNKGIKTYDVSQLNSIYQTAQWNKVERDNMLLEIPLYIFELTLSHE